MLTQQTHAHLSLQHCSLALSHSIVCQCAFKILLMLYTMESFAPLKTVNIRWNVPDMRTSTRLPVISIRVDKTGKTHHFADDEWNNYYLHT